MICQGFAYSGPHSGEMIIAVQGPIMLYLVMRWIEGFVILSSSMKPAYSMYSATIYIQLTCDNGSIPVLLHSPPPFIQSRLQSHIESSLNPSSATLDPLS